MVTHKGRSADSGDYVGWTHLKDDTLAKYDDDLVAQVPSQDILDLKGGRDWHMAYLRLYRKMQIIPQRDKFRSFKSRYMIRWILAWVGEEG